MSDAELSEVQARRSRQFSEAQVNAMSMYCKAERDLKDSQAENDKLRELVARMARALTIGGDWCDRDCLAEFGCTDSCPIADAMRELGIEADE